MWGKPGVKWRKGGGHNGYRYRAHSWIFFADRYYSHHLADIVHQPNEAKLAEYQHAFAPYRQQAV